jgi:hypothetical protein
MKELNCSIHIKKHHNKNLISQKLCLVTTTKILKQKLCLVRTTKILKHTNNVILMYTRKTRILPATKYWVKMQVKQPCQLTR